MLAAGIHSFFDQQLDRPRVDREVAHRRREKLLFLKGKRMQDMFDRDVILVPFFRFAERGLQNTLPAFAELVLICVYICHKTNCAVRKSDAGEVEDFA